MNGQGNDNNWFTRNWKWAVPSGCLVVLLIFGLFAGGIVYFVFKMIKQSDVYEDAVYTVSQNEACIEALGTPMEEGWFVSGSINITGSSGDADLTIPITGPYGEGTIFAVAEKKAGIWYYQLLEVEIQGQAGRITIIE